MGDFNLGFIGGGNMSTAILKGILKSDAHPAAKIWVSGPHIENLKHCTDLGVNVTTDNGVIFHHCEMVFLGVKVNKLHEVVASIRQTPMIIKRKIVLISMLAGVTIQQLNELFAFNESEIIRIMPNTPITVGSGICLYTPDSRVSAVSCQILEKLLSGSAICEKVPESSMDCLGTLTACGPAFMYLVIEALSDGAVKQGVPRAMATRHAAEMMIGSAQMVLKTGKHPALLKDEVCSPGGSTICGITALENGKLRATLINAIEASTNRNKELGK